MGESLSFCKYFSFSIPLKHFQGFISVSSGKRVLKNSAENEGEGDLSIIIRIFSKKSHFPELLQQLPILSLTLLQYLGGALQNIIRKMVPCRFLNKVNRQGKEKGLASPQARWGANDGIRAGQVHARVCTASGGVAPGLHIRYVRWVQVHPQDPGPSKNLWVRNFSGNLSLVALHVNL